MATKVESTVSIHLKTTCFHPEFYDTMHGLSRNEFFVMMLLSFAMEESNMVWVPKEAKRLMAGDLQVSIAAVTKAINGLAEKGCVVVVSKDRFMVNPFFTIRDTDIDPEKIESEYKKLKAKQ